MRTSLREALAHRHEGALPISDDFSLYRLEITMETNPKDNDRSASWIAQQNHADENRFVTAQDDRQPFLRPQNPRPQQRSTRQKPGTAEKMPKARALALANRLKRWLAIASIVSFGTFGGLVALHEVGSTTTQTASVSTQNSKSISKQQGGNNFGTSTATPTATSQASKASTATNKTSGTSTATPTPVSGTSVS